MTSLTKYCIVVLQIYQIGVDVHHKARVFLIIFNNIILHYLIRPQGELPVMTLTVFNAVIMHIVNVVILY